MNTEPSLLASKEETEKAVRKAVRTTVSTALSQFGALIPFAGFVIGACFYGLWGMAAPLTGIGIGILALITLAALNPWYAKKVAAGADLEALRAIPAALEHPEKFDFNIFFSEPIVAYLPWLIGQLSYPKTSPNNQAVDTGRALVKAGFTGTLEEGVTLLTKGGWQYWIESANKKPTS